MVEGIADVPGDSVRSHIFMELIESMDQLTPSVVAQRVGTSRENAYHHLSWLASAGLIINDSGEYYAQPPLIDTAFRSHIDAVLSELAPVAADKMYLDDEWSETQRAHAVGNCIQVAVAISIFDQQ